MDDLVPGYIVKVHNCPYGRPYEEKEDADLMALALNQGRTRRIATVSSVFYEPDRILAAA